MLKKSPSEVEGSGEGEGYLKKPAEGKTDTKWQLVGTFSVGGARPSRTRRKKGGGGVGGVWGGGGGVFGVRGVRMPCDTIDVRDTAGKLLVVEENLSRTLGEGRRGETPRQ